MSSEEAIQMAKVEVARCQRAVDRGSPLQFWIDRLEVAAKNYGACVAILRMQIAALEHQQRLTPPPATRGSR